MLQHAHGCGFLIKKCDVKGGEGGGQKVNVIVTLRSAKVVWKCPQCLTIIQYSSKSAQPKVTHADLAKYKQVAKFSQLASVLPTMAKIGATVA